MYLKQILIFFFVDINLISSKNLNCLSSTDNFKCKLTTMTPYRFISNNTDDSELIIPGCEAKKIWLLIRHGTRYPGRRILSKIDRLPHIQRVVLNNCQTHNCPLDENQRIRLAEWKSNISIDDGMILTTEGQNELIALGERFQSRFPHLMPEKYTNISYKFKFTASQRTEESAKHFAIGLFGKQQSHNVWYPKAEHNDPILRFYKACAKWEHDVKQNPNTYGEIEKFKRSQIVMEMLEDLSNRFNYKFDFDTIELIRKVCAFETAWSETNISPWCDFLTLDQFEIMEFIHDLQYYWTDGYGFELTYKQACPALEDMFNFISTDNDVKTSAYFTHSGTLLKVLSLLGIAKDEKPLLQAHYNVLKDRLWRTSLIDAFASNIAFVLYDCKLTEPSILVMHQERIVQLPGCPNEFPCPISTIKKNYPVDEKNCNFIDICSINEQH